ncbi:MAG: UDP-N-acetylglucosamine 2-epimerase (non-hydrolyzing) [Thermoguttaceae bacterium]|nr:UDP-N-acetylglucosamine 2-epimerase (non-hydrolyzing) [Thermoguttaceae bacterium]
MKIVCVAGARPNFMKIAPLIRVFKERPEFEPILVHTGQHYDEKMSGLFFRELEIPLPDANLGVGGGSHAVATAETMKAFERVCLDVKPDAVLVVGDVNGTLACALVAVKLGIPTVHVEAGLRSGDRTMPEEINRIVVDSISDFLFCTEKSGVENLANEGVASERVFLVGNVMIDSLLRSKAKADALPTLETLDLEPRRYVTATLHRPRLVDDPKAFADVLGALEEIAAETPIIFPIHPRTRNRLSEFGLTERVEKIANLRLVEPLGYLDFLKLNANAFAVLTDSGGLQEETTALGVPCLTLRENTERPITCEIGTNRLVGLDPSAILAAWRDLKNGTARVGKVPPLWDGRAAERIADVLSQKFARR